MPNCRRILLLTCAALLTSPAIADDYRREARVFMALAENEGPDGKSHGIEGTYYFGDVGTDGVPLGEAAFLGRDSLMSLQGHRSGIDGDYQDYWYLNTEIYVPAGVPLFLSAGIQRYPTTTYDPDSNTAREDHDTAWDAAIGITPLDGLRIATRFYEHVDYDPNVDVKYVGTAGNGRWFGIGVNLREPDQGDLSWGVFADFFPDRTLRFGTSYDHGYRSVWLVAEKFFTTRASLLAGYVTSDFGDGFRIEGAWRF